MQGRGRGTPCFVGDDPLAGLRFHVAWNVLAVESALALLSFRQ